MLSLRIAIRYLRAKKSHTAVNVITLIAVIGVAIASMAMVLVLSIFNGFSDLAESQLSSLDPDLAIVPAKGKVISDADSVVAVALATAGVERAMPTVSDRALLVFNASRLPVMVKGVPEGYDEATRIDSVMLAGQYATATTTGYPAIQLGVGVANNMNGLPDAESPIQLFAPRRHARVNPANPMAAFRSEDVVVSGVFRVGNTDVDGEYVIVPLETARQLFDYEKESSAVEISLATAAGAEKVKKELRQKLGSGYKVLNRIEQRPDSFRMISIEKWVTFMMLIFILIIALFNVISTLSLLAIEKRENMRTLRALGAPSKMISRVFIAEGFLVTTIGGLVGIVAGVGLALLQQYTHIIKMSGDPSMLNLNYYPVRVAVGDIFIIAAVVAVLAVVVSGVAMLITRKK